MSDRELRLMKKERRGNRIARLFMCSGCGFYFGDESSPAQTDLSVELGIADAWCPCQPWDIGAVQVGMKLPQGTVSRVDRVRGEVGFVDGSILAFADVGRPE